MSNIRIAACFCIGLVCFAFDLSAQQKSGEAGKVKQSNPEATSDGNASIGAAARKGDTVTILALLKKPGADVNAKSLAEKTPLMWAALYGHLKTVEALVSAGARIEEKDSGGATALTYATAGVHEDVVTFLKSKGAQPVTMEKLGRAMWILGQGAEVFQYMGERAKEAKKK